MISPTSRPGKDSYICPSQKTCVRHRIVGYAFSNRIDTHLTLDALNMAVRREKPSSGLIFHSDRGSQYAAHPYQERLLEMGFLQSMSRKGTPYDNVEAEISLTVSNGSWYICITTKPASRS